MTYLFIEDLHGWGAIIILGTGAGIAFFMLMAHRRASADFIACTAAMVVICGHAVRACGADRRANHRGYPDEASSTATPERWLAAAPALYAIAGLLSGLVMFMLIEMRDLAGAAAGRQRRCRRGVLRCFAAGFIAAFSASVRL